MNDFQTKIIFLKYVKNMVILEIKYLILSSRQKKIPFKILFNLTFHQRVIAPKLNQNTQHTTNNNNNKTKYKALLFDVQ